MTDREAMQQALEALELLAWCENPATRVQVRKPRNGGPIVTVYPHKVATEAAAPLRERLAQPEPPPECQTEQEKTAFAFGYWKAIAAEREACAALVDANAMACHSPIYRSLLQSNADAIRLRGNQ